jgi:hypothetical protein
MRNALRAALHLRVREADQAVAAARARMNEIAHKLREQPHPSQDLELGRQLDEAARNLELARAFAEGVKATCEFLTEQVLEDSEPRPPADDHE